MIKVKQIKARAYHLMFDTLYDLTMSFVRIQEFYESPNPNFRGQEFQLEDFIDWYATKYGKGVFTYTTDWAGFNVPSHIVQDFFKKIPPSRLRLKEKLIAEALKGVGIDVFDTDTPPYYVIGSTKNDEKGVLDHEIRHGMFYLMPEYRCAMEEAIRKYRLQGLRSWLMRAGYAKHVVVDEIQAYILTGLPRKMKWTKEMFELRKELREIEKEFLK